MALAAYVAATVAMTWPLVAGLGRDIPWDLGDSLLNCWILGWDADHIRRFLSGDLHAFAGFWTANIYHGEPLTLAYSEHLVAQAIQILPVYLFSKNLILAYDVLFFSTFVLSGFGAYLLVRDLTGRPVSAFVAGLIFAFAPYRIGQFSHVQVLSAQWMPFALFAFRRYFETRRPTLAAGAAAATIAQNLSCGYFMVFFAPFLAAYVLYEIADRRLWRDARMWRDLAIAAIAIAVATWPFVSPYLQLRAHGFPRRPIEEVTLYSGDVYSYLTAHGAERLYGEWLRAYPKAEGDLFTGFVPIVLALVGVVIQGRLMWRRSGEISTHQTPDPEPRTPSARARRIVVVVLAFLVIVNAVAAAALVATAGFAFSLGPLALRAGNVWRVVERILIATPLLLALSPRARRVARGVPTSALAFYVAALVAAFWMSLGPVPMAMGRRIAGAAFYWYFYEYVPGFDGLRVPARLAMLVMLFLAVVAGYGAAAIESRWRKGAPIVLAAGLLFLVEAAAAPVEMNGTFASEDFVAPVSRVLPPDRAPQVYRFLHTLPASAVIAEFPFGDDPYELRYMYYSTVHWRPLVNGYSGGFPESYLRHRAALRRPLARPEIAFDSLLESGATHAVVHEAAFRSDEGLAVSEWLRESGAQLVGTFGRDKVFMLPPRR